MVYIIMIFCLLISARLVKEIIKLKSVDKRLKDADLELLLAQQEQIELKKQLEEVESKSWWEKRVRNVLKMAKPGEVIIVIPEEVVKQAAETGEFVKIAEDENLSNMQKWWRILVD
ncbi:MAG: septum formation initiator family protein [Patescibacteria group bacterium]|nr:septum formation initiator family protein [Patescibacteria group bacterium]